MPFYHSTHIRLIEAKTPSANAASGALSRVLNVIRRDNVNIVFVVLVQIIRFSRGRLLA